MDRIVLARNLAEGLDIDDTTAMSLWDGTRVRADDLSWAIASLHARRARTGDPTDN